MVYIYTVSGTHHELPREARHVAAEAADEGAAAAEEHHIQPRRLGHLRRGRGKQTGGAADVSRARGAPEPPCRSAAQHRVNAGRLERQGSTASRPTRTPPPAARKKWGGGETGRRSSMLEEASRRHLRPRSGGRDTRNPGRGPREQHAAATQREGNANQRREGGGRKSEKGGGGTKIR